MAHPDLELLLGGLDAAPQDVRAHVAGCDVCRDELSTIRRARAAGDLLEREPGLASLTAPPPEVWEAIRREAALESTVVALPARTGRRTRWVWVAAAVAGAVLGSAVTWAATHRGDTTRPVAATSELVPLGQHRTRGTISLSGAGSQARVSLAVSGLDPGPGFTEVWLLDARTGGMVALGVLDGDHGSWAVPADLDLTSYDQVDVSREPYDGNPAHSKVSLARGRLP